MSLDMNSAVKTNYSKVRTRLPKIQNKKRVENLEIVGKQAKWSWWCDFLKYLILGIWWIFNFVNFYENFIFNIKDKISIHKPSYNQNILIIIIIYSVSPYFIKIYNPKLIEILIKKSKTMAEGGNMDV